MKTMVVVDNLGYSLANYELFKNIDNLIKKKNEEISLVPVDMSNKVVDFTIPVHNMVTMGNFNNGILISSTIRNAKRIISTPNKSMKVLYLYDLDWMFLSMNYSFIKEVLCNEDLKLIVRSENHNEFLLKAFDVKPIGVVEKYDLEKIWNLLKETKTKY